MEEYPTGARRDDLGSKPALELISPYAAEELGRVLKDGASHYGSRNWEKGIPNSRHLGSALRHLSAYLRGDSEPYHLGKAIFNIAAIIHNNSMISMGLLPDTLDDLPYYERRLHEGPTASRRPSDGPGLSAIPTPRSVVDHESGRHRECP